MSIINISFESDSSEGSSRFEYDPRKSASNLQKHGIDFEHAQELWKDIDALRIRVDYESEERYIVIGVIDGKHWTAVITYRGRNIRIISVRRSRKEEVARYGQKD